jgi:DNA-3-methyladenine glycosylase II
MIVHKKTVRLPQPFDLNTTVDSWIYPDIQPVPEVKTPGQWARCIPIGAHLVPVRVQQLSHGPTPELQVEWSSNKRIQPARVISKVEWLLGWDLDMRPVLRAINADPVIKHLVDTLMGLRPYSQPSLFEALVKAILQQQVSFRSANQVTRQLVLAYGSIQHLGRLEVYGFPTLEVLAPLSEADLRACKLGYKAPYLVKLFQDLSHGRFHLEDLRTLESPEAITRLDALHGVGPWTAELTVLSGLRRLEVFPAGDLGARAIISKLYLEGQPAKRKDVERVSARWGQVNTLVLYFLMSAQVLGLV